MSNGNGAGAGKGGARKEPRARRVHDGVLRLSVVMATYNRADLLVRVLEQLAQQKLSHGTFEVIVEPMRIPDVPDDAQNGIRAVAVYGAFTFSVGFGPKRR